MTLDVLTRDEVKALVAQEVARILGELSSPSDLLDVRAAAQRLGISVSTLYKKANAGVVPSVKEGGRLLFEPAALTTHIEKHRRSQQRVAGLAAAARSGR